jgi:hypothetical protein
MIKYVPALSRTPKIGVSSHSPFMKQFRFAKRGKRGILSVRFSTSRQLSIKLSDQIRMNML